jgi:hypothetical protein
MTCGLLGSISGEDHKGKEIPASLDESLALLE